MQSAGLGQILNELLYDSLKCLVNFVRGYFHGLLTVTRVADNVS